MDYIVSKIQRFSLEDGPGIRTTVFLKGCNFSCKWCHNPEAIGYEPVLGVDATRCDGCLRCLPYCPTHALSYEQETIKVDRSRCNNCGICVDECFKQVFSLCGTRYSEDSLFAEIVEDTLYFERSGGGVSFSGGEPLVQLPALLSILKRCKDAKIHTLVQTNLSLPFEESLPYVDHYMVDLKVMDPEKHRQWIGKDNLAVLRNIRNLDNSGACYEIRTPIIPGFNDTEEDVLKIVSFVKELSHCKRYRLLGYHPLGLPKYSQFGVTATYDYPQALDAAVLRHLQNLVEKEMV
ncbi:MAG: glycyl-radical enzyme activating protein [Sphaerochaeta sp.]